LDNVRNSPGRRIHSVAQASFEAWTKYYRPDANTPNTTVSYYTKGALVGLCLDLTLRREGKTTLDAVVRALYERCYAASNPPTGMTEHDVRAVLQDLGGRSFAREIAAWVHGTDELPVETLLQEAGIDLLKRDADLGRQWGLRCKEDGSILVQAVFRGGAAEVAGFAPGDEWLGVEVEPTFPGAHTAWRVRSLADVKACLPPAAAQDKKDKKTPQRLTALVARDRRLLRLNLELPAKAEPHWKLQIAADDGTRKNWPWA
ncbi:MAG: peptidase M61, partial [Brachymonas sp.]|nr:peptidase M61 [Brachymonas sp.]